MKSLICAFLILATGVAGAVSGEIPAPRDSVILTVTGKIEHHNGGGSARFDAGMLQALPARVTAAATPWYPRKTIFEGPLGSALLDMVGAKGTTLRVTALNDYAVDIPAEDFRKWPV